MRFQRDEAGKGKRFASGRLPVSVESVLCVCLQGAREHPVCLCGSLQIALALSKGLRVLTYLLLVGTVGSVVSLWGTLRHRVGNCPKTTASYKAEPEPKQLDPRNWLLSPGSGACTLLEDVWLLPLLCNCQPVKDGFQLVELTLHVPRGSGTCRDRSRPCFSCGRVGI